TQPPDGAPKSGLAHPHVPMYAGTGALAASESVPLEARMVHPVSAEVQMVKRVALIFGVVFILVGVLGFFSMGGMQMGVEPPGMELGLFPVNVLHNCVHVLFGIWGVVASRSFSGAQLYCKVAGIVYLVLAV